MLTTDLLQVSDEWVATYLVVAPIAKTVTKRYGAECPEDREIEAEIARLGEVASVHVRQAARVTPGWAMKNAVYHGLVKEAS